VTSSWSFVLQLSEMCTSNFMCDVTVVLRNT